jgi:hypothetical protein
MTKKKLNTDAITSELSGASAFFAQRTPPQVESPAPQPPATHQAVEPPPVSPSVGHQAAIAPNVSTNEQPLKRSFQRKKLRHTFDIYYDQLLSLRELALSREMLFGERVLLGDLVQEALDMFITKERNNE